MKHCVCAATIAVVLIVAPGTAIGQDATALLGIDRLLEKADSIAKRLEGTGDSWTRQWTDSLRGGSDAVQEAARRLEQGVATAAAELRLAQGRLVLLVDRAEQAFANQRACTRQDLRYLLATVDASANSIGAANIPWNRAGHFVAAGHAVGNPMRVGTKVGTPIVFELEGSYPRRASRCGKPTARLVPLILTQDSKEQAKAIPLDVVGIDDRRIRVRVPAVPLPGQYNIQVAYATSSGVLNTCDADWTYASWVLPVAAPNREHSAIDYSITPTCYSLESTVGEWATDLRSENCEVKQDSITKEEGCRFTSVNIEYVTGDRMASYEILDGGRRLVATERSLCRECRTWVLGRCVDWLNHFGQHVFHARWACNRVREGRLRAISGSFTLKPGEAGSHDMALPDEVSASRDGRMCRWSMTAKVTRYLNGTQVERDEQSHEQPPPAQHSTLGSEGAEWFRSASPTSEVGNMVAVQGHDWRVAWLPDAKRVSAVLSRSGVETCGLFE